MWKYKSWQGQQVFRTEYQYELELLSHGSKMMSQVNQLHIKS